MDRPENMYDVAIIGGGVAGLTLSIQCADEGYNAILFEKETYPFHKVCGEYISLESYSFLEQLGLTLKEFDVPIIKKLQLTDVRGKLYEFDLDLGGFGISRYKLDNALYEIAIAKGVHVLTGIKVVDVNFDNDVFTIHTTNGNFISKIAAGTFGKRSNLDIKWKRNFITQKHDKLNNYIGVKYHIKYSFEKKNNNSVAQMEKNVLWKNPVLKEIFNKAKFLYNEPLVISQISFSKKEQVENHVLMIGDSAGLITPLCGNGMSMAMHAGKLAFAGQ